MDDAIRIPVRYKGEIVGQALVDPEFAYLAERRWMPDRKGYALGWLIDRSLPGGGRKVRMHRVVMGLTPADRMQVDHVNRNKLDCRRSNLRLATNAQNHQNVPSMKGSTSQYRGVYWNTRRQRWVARVMIDGRHKHLGYFTLEDDAGTVAREYRRIHMPFSTD